MDAVNAMDELKAASLRTAITADAVNAAHDAYGPGWCLIDRC